MALRKRHLLTPPPQTHLLSSPALPAIRSSPLSSGTILTPSVSVSPFTSSPVLSPVGRESSASPDYFEDFAYSLDMDDDLRRINWEFSGVFPDGDGDNVGGQVLTMSAHESKTWVVFCGKTPGIYDNGLSAAMQIQGYSDAFQRAFSDLDAATQAWNAYVREKIYPDYGKAPWVVFLGCRPGVFTKVSELEACVRGYENAIFRSCSSVAEAKIKFQLFAERVNQIFSVPDPFAGVEALMPQRAEEISETAPCTVQSIAPSIAPVPTAPLHPPSSPPPVAESSKAASKRRAHDSPLTPLLSKLKASRPGDGWYVVHHGVLPGVYYGAKAVQNAKPEPGGVTCASSQKEAEQLFLDLTINCALVFVEE